LGDFGEKAVTINNLLYLVKEVKGDQFLIGNNLGKINGWVPASAIRGKEIAVENG
jgi:hypothetical protein